MSYDNMSSMEIDYQNESNDDDMSVTDVEIEEIVNTSEFVHNNEVEELPEEVNKILKKPIKKQKEIIEVFEKYRIPFVYVARDTKFWIEEKKQYHYYQK